MKSLLNKACLLDPCFKALSFLSQTEKTEIISMIEEETLKMAMTSNQVQPHVVDPPTKKLKQEKKGLMSLLEDVIKSSIDKSANSPSSNSAST